MERSGRGSGMVAYNVQSAVDTTNHLIVAHEVTNVGTDRSQLATMAQAAKAALGSDNLDVVADRATLKVRKSWHANRPGRGHAAQTANLGRQVGRPLWETRFCLFGQGRCLSLPGRREAGAPLHR